MHEPPGDGVVPVVVALDVVVRLVVGAAVVELVDTVVVVVVVVEADVDDKGDEDDEVVDGNVKRQLRDTAGNG